MKKKFNRIITDTKGTFIGNLDDDNYCEIQYVGWHLKGIKNYRIQIWRDECGLIIDKITRFANIEDAISWAVRKIGN